MYMATMASTSHGMSVWANTCVKNPINPKTGLSATLPERKTVKIVFDENIYGLHKSSDEFELRDKLARERSSKQQVGGIDPAELLQCAKEEEFYDKLQQLKDENKKTLEAYERLYQEKLRYEGIYSTQPVTYQPDKSGVDREVDNDIPVSPEHVVNGLEKSVFSDRTQAVAKKPPPGKPRSCASDVPIVSKSMLQRNEGRERRDTEPADWSDSFEKEEWLKFLERRQEKVYADDNFFIPVDSQQSDYEKALSRIDHMWEDFKISEHTQRRHSFSGTPSKSKKDKSNKTSTWKHRITIPQPFNMTVRESLKSKSRTSAQEELELRRLEKQKEEEAECEKKFKAQPAPAHIYLPLYHEITEKNETRRKYMKQYSQELMRSQVKPFNFDMREQEKKIQRQLSAPPPKREKSYKNGFKARPPPSHIFSPAVDEKLQEDEELRKIRVKMRARELLQESSLPPNMAAREKLKEQEKKEKARQAKKAAAKKTRPKSAHLVPDYDTLYREFQKELSQRRREREGTVVEPFDLETERIRSSHEKIRQDIEADERRLKENRWPFQGSRTTPRSSLNYLGALSTSLDSIPACSTKSADLRSSVIKNDRTRQKQCQEDEEEAERRRRVREAKLRKYLAERAGTDDVPNPRESIASRLKKIKQEDRQRQENYQREMEEMKARVDESPLLVEKYIKERARREAEKKFTTTLKNAGFNDSQFESARETGSMRSMGGYGSEHDEGEEFADTTYTKAVSDRDSEREEEWQ